MTHDPSTPPEDSGLPPRHRISLEKLQKEAAESDLWNLDDETETPAVEPPGEAFFEEPLEPLEEDNGFHQPGFSSYEEAPSEPEIEYPHETIADPAPEPYEPEPNQPRRSPLDDLGELEGIDNWEDDDVTLPTPHSASDIQNESEPHDLPPTHERAQTEPSEQHRPAAKQDPAEFHRKRSISRNEWIAIASVALGLVVVAGFFLINALSGLPRMQDPHQQPKLPAKGNHFSITKVHSYWRAPITIGPDADTVQRGTELIPVLEITAAGQDAAIRIQFRNSDGASVGDPITHALKGKTTLVIPSTAGLEDANIHNAYRTNLIDPWTAEILEASAGTTAGSAFRSLITLPISPDRR